MPNDRPHRVARPLSPPVARPVTARRDGQAGPVPQLPVPPSVRRNSMPHTMAADKTETMEVPPTRPAPAIRLEDLIAEANSRDEFASYPPQGDIVTRDATYAHPRSDKQSQMQKAIDDMSSDLYQVDRPRRPLGLRRRRG